MGSANAPQDWKNDYEPVPFNQFDSSRTMVKRKTSQQRSEMITLYLSNQKQIETLFERLKRRETFRSHYLVPFEKVYHNEDKNLCGNNYRYELITPQPHSTLFEHLNLRKTKQQPFRPEEVMYVIQNTCLGLKDLKAMEDQHGNITLKTIIVNDEVLLEDPIVSSRNQYESSTYKTKKIEGYPSPSILLHQIDSGMRIDKFREDLFSVGLVALQMLNLDASIKSIYQNNNKKYQNVRINFEILFFYIDSIKYQPLKQWIATLLHQNSEERLNIFSLIQNVNIPRNSLLLLKDKPKTITPEEQLAKTSQPPPLPPLSEGQNLYPHPQLIFSTNQLQNMADSQSSLAQGSFFNSGKISFRSVPSVQTLNPQLFQTTHPVQVQYNTPTFNKPEFSRGSSPERHTYHIQSLHSSIPEEPQKQIYTINDSRPQAIQPQIAPDGPNSHLQPSAEMTSHNPYWLDVQTSRHPSLQNQHSERYMQSYYKEIPKYREKKRSPEVESTNTFSTFHNAPKIQEQRKQSNKDELNKQIQELQRLKKENSEIQNIINSGAANLFQKHGLSLPEQEIREVTEEDSRIEEATFVTEDYQDGTKYEGFIKDHLRNGYGKIYYKGGSIYDGEWKNNCMNGYGTLYYPEGNIAYQGNWKNDEFSGNGTIYNDNPQIIKGNFDYTNFRRLENDQWQSYNGECQNSKKHGKGKLTLSNGEVYEGEFHMDIPHGSGVFTQSRGSKIRGIWSDGVLKTIVD